MKDADSVLPGGWLVGGAPRSDSDNLASLPGEHRAPGCVGLDLSLSALPALCVYLLNLGLVILVTHLPADALINTLPLLTNCHTLLQKP